MYTARLKITAALTLNLFATSLIDSDKPSGRSWLYSLAVISIVGFTFSPNLLSSYKRAIFSPQYSPTVSGFLILRS